MRKKEAQELLEKIFEFQSHFTSDMESVVDAVGVIDRLYELLHQEEYEEEKGDGEPKI